MNSNQPPSPDKETAECRPVVLVVDDDNTHQKTMELLAERLGITVFAAATCADAVQALSKCSFDVILMDYRMPQMDGFVCAKRIREWQKNMGNIPIIAVTAHVLEVSREAALEAGLDDYLAKPFTIDELQAKLGYWLQAKQEK